jgi:CRISPR/Cas system-associated exonuclease Cas4 (RecB family)
MDYYRCPMMYKFKHVLGIQKESMARYETVELERFRTCLDQAVMFFYYTIMNGRTPTLAHLQSKWFKLWDASAPFQAEEVAFKDAGNARRKAVKSNLRVDAVKLLDKFYTEELEKEFMPIIVDTDVKVKIGNYYVTGRIDLVREVKESGKNIVELTRFTGTRYGLDRFLVLNDFKFMYSVFAFRKLFETTEDVAIIRDIKKDERMTVEFNNSDFRKLETIINNIGDNIVAEKFHPQVMHQCLLTCPYKEICERCKY